MLAAQNTWGPSVKLFRSTMISTLWFAFSPESGWVMFPSEAGGWQKRQPARVIDPLYVREVRLRLGFNAGIPGAPMSASGAWGAA
jgi:hypothetical protein